MRQPRRARKTALFLGAFALAALLPALRAESRPDDGAVELDVAQAHSRSCARAARRGKTFTVAVRAGDRAGGVASSGGEEFGAGIIVRCDGYVLTALHIVQGGQEIVVVLPDGREMPAQVHARDPQADLALLRLLAPGLELETARIVDDAELEVGETVLSIGHPFGLESSVSVGTLSARGRRGVVADNTAPLLQTDASINPGCSGGPLLDLRGDVIGMVNAILTRTGGDEGLGFAVPSGELLRALPQLLAGCAVRRPWLGLQVKSGVSGRTSVVVLQVHDGGPAQRAGIRAGDFVERMDGVPFHGLDEFRGKIRDLDVGGRVRLGLRRGADHLDLELEVGLLE